MDGNTVQTDSGPAIRISYDDAACLSKKGNPRPTGKNQIINNMITSTKPETNKIQFADLINNLPHSLASNVSNNLSSGRPTPEEYIKNSTLKTCLNSRMADETYSIFYKGNGNTSGTITSASNPFPKGTRIFIK